MDMIIFQNVERDFDEDGRFAGYVSANPSKLVTLGLVKVNNIWLISNLSE